MAMKSSTAHQLVSGPPVSGHSIQHHELQHIWIIDQTLLTCSRSEYRCLEILLEHVNQCVPFAQLAVQCQTIPSTEVIWDLQTRRKVWHVMSRLRTKVWALGLDIVCVIHVGYILLSEAQPTGGQET